MFQTPLQTDAIFRAASMTKITTSLAAMMLYDRGLLLWKLDRIPEAVASLDSAIQHEPSRAEFLDERGVAAGAGAREEVGTNRSVEASRV